MSDVDSARGRRQAAAVNELVVGHQLITGRLGQALRHLGITLTQVSFLSHLAANGGSAAVGDIAVAMEVNQPAVSKTMKALVEMAAIVARTELGDARRRTAELTDNGWDLLREAQLTMHPVADLAFGPLTDRGLDEFIGALGRIRAELETG